ncbi:hypothetical protein V1525DRAFT_97649 [Lipomyces kononenkoae]|uniref:Uncharacterized protein n=1 Tax=Lipomyces kononenkoae TaxID=34357 RepID=A0ACC3TAZ8_LIPKO
MASLLDPDTLQPTTELQNVAPRTGTDVRSVPGAFGQQSSTSTNDDENGQQSEPTGEPQSELMTAAQRNEVEVVERLLSSGQFSVQDTSPDGATALHWAAINNGIETVTYLLDHGAEIDRKGGELMATPLHWACRVGLTNVANLLIQRGADPLRTDAQGFNALHIAIHSSNIMLIVYFLHQGLPVDYTDPQGRTALHWAAYQGDALSVDVLLRWGANVKIKDSTGFTPLHWAVVRGNMSSMKRLIEEGSDLNAETNDGKTPAIIAREMMCYPIWTHALKKAGRDADGTVVAKRLSRTAVNRIVFLWPFFVLWICFQILVYINFVVAIAFVIVFIWGSHQILLKVLDVSRPGAAHNIYKTPYLAGIFSGSAFWVAVRWLFKVLPNTYNDALLLNVAFALTFGSAMFFFVKSMLMDPGYIPKPSGVSEQRQVIEDLLAVGEYDSRHFCIFCFTRRPLRSKHCKICERCVARLDHHCPWISNCVAVRNHRPFLLYVLLLEIGIPIFAYLVYEYTAHADDNESNGCLILNDALCARLRHDAFTIYIAIWSCLQLTWVTFLTVVQLYQISRSITTNEAYNLHTYGWMGGGGDEDPVPSNVPDPYAPDKPGAFTHSHVHPQRSSLGICCKLLGITQFFNLVHDLFSGKSGLSWFSASAADRHRRRRRPAVSSHYNPFDNGCASNCKDFWGGGDAVFKQPLMDLTGQGGQARIGGLNVDYYRLWDVTAGNIKSGASSSQRLHNADEDYEAVPGDDNV